MKHYIIVLSGLLALIFCVLNGRVYAEGPAGAHPKSDSKKPLIEVTLNIPKLDADPYHRPYVAVWLETADRKPVATLAVWHEKDTWLKDMRQWWRKIGRAGKGLDAVSGATRKPGTYTIVWYGDTISGAPVTKGEYQLNIEASREEGGRSYVRQQVLLGAPSSITLPAEEEFGEAAIQLHALE